MEDVYWNLALACGMMALIMLPNFCFRVPAPEKDE
jgi:hypothetical protein